MIVLHIQERGRVHSDDYWYVLAPVVLQVLELQKVVSDPQIFLGLYDIGGTFLLYKMPYYMSKLVTDVGYMAQKTG
jgi:hypothetical protein